MNQNTTQTGTGATAASGTTVGTKLGTFSKALEVLKEGGKIFRGGWNGQGQFIGLQNIEGGTKMTLPYLYIKNVQGDFVPFVASQTDILANDWFVI